MAALDFGMALSRGMLPQSEKAQKDLLDLAGGRNIFKSEDWWNKQVDKQISEGYRQAEQETRYLTESGYKPRAGTTTTYGRTIMGQFSPMTGPFGMPYVPSYSPIFGYGGGVSARTSDILPEGAIKRNGRAVSKEFEVFRSDAKRKDYTAGELSDIESSAKAGATRAKRQTEQSKASQKRLRRGTGGLLAKAPSPEDTGLPALGVTGLGIMGDLFGAKQEL